MGVVGAYVAYNAIAIITNGILAAQAIFAKMKAAADMMQAGATFTATVAQHGLNAALLACPLTWILIIIIAVIAAIYAIVAAINKFAGTSYSATGLIAGYFAALFANIYNGFVVKTWNSIAAFINFFANVFTNPIGSNRFRLY